MITLTTFFEYAAFGSSICSAWLYGKQGIKGPIAGLVTVTMFMIFGLVSEIYAAVGANVIFAFIHIRNLKYAMENRK